MGSSTITIRVNGQWNGSALQKAASDLGSFGKSIMNNTKLWESQGQKVATLMAMMDSSVSSGLAKASTQLALAGQEVYNLGDRIDQVGQKLTRGVTVPLVALGGYAGAMAVQYDTAMANVRKVTDMTEAELGRLGDAALELSTTQPVTADQILNIEALGAQLGIADSRLQSFASTVAGLEISTNLGWEQAATQLAQFANITGMADTEYENFGSTIVHLGNNLATTEKDIMNMGMRLAAAGSIAGMTDAEILGLSGAMSSLGIRAEAGGSAMTTIISNISKAAATGGEDLNAFAQVAGMSASEFAQAWESDPMSALQSLLEGIARLDESGQDMNVTLSELGINEIRQSDAMRRLASNTDLLSESVDMATSAWEENTALQAEVDQRNESMASRLQTLMNKVNAIAIQVGGPLVEALIDVLSAAQPVIDVAADLAQSFADADEGTQQMVIGFGAAAAAAGPLLSSIGGVTKVVGNFMSSVGRVGQGLAVYRDALETVDGAHIRNYASAGTLESKLGLLGNRVVEAAGGADEYVKVWERAEDAQKQVGSLEKQISDALSGQGKAARMTAGEIDEYVDALGRQQAAAEDVYNKNKKVLDGWQQQASQTGKTSSRVDSLTNSMKKLDPATMKAADSIEGVGSKTRLMGDALTVGTSKLGSMVAEFGKLALGGAAIAGVSVVIGLLASRIAEMNRQQEEANKAQETFAGIADRAAGAAQSEADAISDLGKRCEESFDSFLELQETAFDTMSDFETQSATLDDYVATINELGNKSNLSATEQERLKAAVEGYNSITGESVSVTDAANGKLSEGIDVINANTEAWKRNAQAQALQQLYTQYAQAHAEAELNQAHAKEQLAAAQDRLNNATSYFEKVQAGEEVKYWSEQLANANDQLESSATSMDEINTKIAANSEAVYPYTEALKGFGDGFATALAEAGVSMDALAVKIQEANIPLDTLTTLGPQKLQNLASSCNGNVEQMVWAMSTLGTGMTDADAILAGAAASMREQLGSLSETGGMNLDQLSFKLANAGVTTEQLNAIGTANLQALAAECGYDMDAMIAAIQSYNDKELEDKESKAEVKGNAVDGSAKSGIDGVNDATNRMHDANANVNVSGNYSWASGVIAGLVSNINSLAGRYVEAIANVTFGGNAAGGIRTHADGGFAGVQKRYHAVGAIATRAVPLDIVGEDGAEAIVPLTNRRYAMPFVSMIAEEFVRRAGVAGTTNNYTLYINGDQQTMAPRVMEALRVVFDEYGLTADMGC